MITFLIGDNSFEVARTLKRIVAQHDGEIERLDGLSVAVEQLPDLFMGATLFSARRLVVIKELAENKSVWNSLPDWLPRIDPDTQVVFVDGKPDKRTKTYKALMKVAEIQEFPAWTDRDRARSEQWLAEEARRRKIECDPKVIRTLVDRVGVDQWQLTNALEKLSVLDVITLEVVERVIEANPAENVFNLFEAALKGDRQRVASMIRTLQATDDPYMVFGLLSSQAFQLAALAMADKPSGEVAKDIGAHPFALSKLAPYARKLGRAEVKRIMAIFTETDTAMKSTSIDPWLQVEKILLKIAS